MENVIEIHLGEDHGTEDELGHLLNEMRDRMVMGVWRQQWYKAQKEQDWDELIRLDEMYLEDCCDGASS